MAVVLVECAVNAFRVKEQVGIQEVWRLRQGERTQPKCVIVWVTEVIIC